MIYYVIKNVINVKLHLFKVKMKKKLLSLFIFFVLFHTFVKANENILELDPNIIAASNCNGMITANAMNDFELGILSEQRARNIVRSVVLSTFLHAIKHKDLQHIQKYQNDYDAFFTDGYDSVMTLFSTESFTWDTQNELNVCNARLIGSIVNLENKDLTKLGIKNFIEFKDKINMSADQRFDYMLNLLKAMQ